MPDWEILLAGVALPLLLAVALDLALGDPAEGGRLEPFYPPVLAGRLGLWIDRHIARGDPARERRSGLLLWSTVVLTAGLLAGLLVLVGGKFMLELWEACLAPQQPVGPEALVLGVIVLVLAVFWIKSVFTLRGLLDFCTRPLGMPLPEKRQETARVVNRDTAVLSEGELNSALIESLAENTTDSWVAPLLAYALFGLVGAVIYRAVNTLDALLGHRDPARLHVGRTSAVIDHAVNLVPDAITAALLRGSRRPSPSEVTVVEGASPPPRSIVAISGALGVRLERPGSYVIRPRGALPGEDDVRRAVRRVQSASFFSLLLSLALIGVLTGVGWTYLL